MSDRRTSRKTRMGRPPLPRGRARNFIAKIMLNDTELNAIEWASKSAGTDTAPNGCEKRFWKPLKRHRFDMGARGD